MDHRRISKLKKMSCEEMPVTRKRKRKIVPTGVVF